MSKGGYENELVRRLISADPGNALRIGTDDKLFVANSDTEPVPAPSPASSDDATG